MPTLIESCIGPGRLAVILGLVAAAAVAADTWQGVLERGGRLSVDPDSRRALSAEDRRPLWDGVHRLEDGSTVIVRDGIVVPTPEMLDAWRGRAVPDAATHLGPCEALVARSCGQRDGCGRAEACLRARQLLNSERAEQRLAPYEAGPRPEVAATEACRAGLAAPSAFPSCAEALPARDGGPCARLIERVCGAGDGCAAGSPCRLARQLQQMERESAAADASARDGIRAQCGEALTNPYFVACD